MAKKNERKSVEYTLMPPTDLDHDDDDEYAHHFTLSVMMHIGTLLEWNCKFSVILIMFPIISVKYGYCYHDNFRHRKSRETSLKLKIINSLWPHFTEIMGNMINIVIEKEQF